MTKEYALEKIERITGKRYKNLRAGVDKVRSILRGEGKFKPHNKRLRWIDEAVEKGKPSTWKGGPRKKREPVKFPEAVAANHGYRRKQFLDKLSRRLNIICHPTKTDICTLCNLLDWAEYRSTEAGDIISQQNIVKGTSNKLIDRLSNIDVMMISPDVAARVGAKVCRKGSDWGVVGSYDLHHHDYEPGWTEWKNGKPYRYHRARNDTYVRSAIRIISDKEADYVVYKTVGRLLLPEGYKWCKDNVGVFVLNTETSQDYHVTSYDVLEGVEHIINSLEENALKRAVSAGSTKDLRDAMDDVYVCIGDVKGTGICAPGLQYWTNKHGIDTAKRYKATDIYMKDPLNDLVSLVLFSALRRHKRELRRGFCELV